MISNHFLCNDLELSNWNNHNKLVVWSSRCIYIYVYVCLFTCFFGSCFWTLPSYWGYTSFILQRQMSQPSKACCSRCRGKSEMQQHWTEIIIFGVQNVKLGEYRLNVPRLLMFGLFPKTTRIFQWSVGWCDASTSRTSRGGCTYICSLLLGLYTYNTPTQHWQCMKYIEIPCEQIDRHPA